MVWWPSPSPNVFLQQNFDLATTNWVMFPDTINDNGSNKYIKIDPPSGNRFFRLFKP
jgi:hypothetical protein